MSIEIWFTFILASTVLLLLPGPTVLLVISYALNHGKKAGLIASIGVALGDFIAMTLSLAGLGALMLASSGLFSLLKWMGAAYLIYLGLTLLLDKSRLSDEQDRDISLKPESESGVARSICLNAAAVTALNPKSLIFFVAFVPQFLDPSKDMSVLLQSSLLVATFVVLAALNAMAYTLLASYLAVLVNRETLMSRLSRIGGGALVVLGAAALFTERPTA